MITRTLFLLLFNNKLNSSIVNESQKLKTRTVLFLFTLIVLINTTPAFIHDTVDEQAPSAGQNQDYDHFPPNSRLNKRAYPYSDDEDYHYYGASGDSKYHYDQYDDYFEDHNYHDSRGGGMDQYDPMFDSTDRSSKYSSMY